MVPLIASALIDLPVVVLVDGLVIVTETAELVLLLQVLSPPYSAVMVWLPAVRAVVAQVALQ